MVCGNHKGGQETILGRAAGRHGRERPERVGMEVHGELRCLQDCLEDSGDPALVHVRPVGSGEHQKLRTTALVQCLSLFRGGEVS